MLDCIRVAEMVINWLTYVIYFQLYIFTCEE
jgi:hypothetical protein